MEARLGYLGMVLLNWQSPIVPQALQLALSEGYDGIGNSAVDNRIGRLHKRASEVFGSAPISERLRSIEIDVAEVRLGTRLSTIPA